MDLAGRVLERLIQCQFNLFQSSELNKVHGLLNGLIFKMLAKEVIKK